MFWNYRNRKLRLSIERQFRNRKMRGEVSIKHIIQLNINEGRKQTLLALLWEQWSRWPSVLRYIDDTRLSHKLVWVFLTVLYETQMVQDDTGWFGIHNFNQISQYHNFDQSSQFQPNLAIPAKFHNISQISQYQPNFIISAKFHNISQISQFQPNFTISAS